VLDASIINALMMEAASTSETSVNFYHTTQHYKPEDSHFHYDFSFILTILKFINFVCLSKDVYASKQTTISTLK
jgi:hypothetical protein